MVDLHSHILPGIDDGPADMEGAVALARAAVEDGTKVLAATPHVREDHPAVRLDELVERCARLNVALSENQVPLEVVVGAEVDVIWTRSASEEDLRLATYGQSGTDMLLETPYGPLPPGFEDWVFSRLSLAGIRVMLAHPEPRVPQLVGIRGWFSGPGAGVCGVSGCRGFVWRGHTAGAALRVVVGCLW